MIRFSPSDHRNVPRRLAPASAGALVAFALAAALLMSAPPRVASAVFTVPPTFTAPIQAAGLTETWTISGWQGSIGNHITSATVVFPTGFTVPQNPTVTITAGAVRCTVVRATTTGQSVALEIQGVCGTGEAPPRQSITIAGVTNPTTPGTNAAAGFKLSTSVDGEMSSARDVVIWSATAGPVLCVDAGGLRMGEVRFTSTASIPALNTGSGAATIVTVATTRGTFVQAPLMLGGFGTTTPIGANTTSALTTVSASLAVGAAVSVSIVAPGVTGVATVTLRTTSLTGGPSVILGSADVTFSEGVCVPPASTPAPTPPAPAPTTPPAAQGVFSGGTIAASGVSLVSFTGTTAQLNAAGAALKIVSVTATVRGKFVTFVVGAPDFTNAEFNPAFPAGLNGTLVMVKT